MSDRIKNRGQCSKCQRDFSLLSDGTVHPHVGGWNGYKKYQCTGSGKLPRQSGEQK